MCKAFLCLLLQGRKTGIVTTLLHVLSAPFRALNHCYFGE